MLHQRIVRLQVSGHPAVAPHMTKFYGIRNGIDQDIWDPLEDRFLPRCPPFALIIPVLPSEYYSLCSAIPPQPGTRVSSCSLVQHMQSTHF